MLKSLKMPYLTFVLIPSLGSEKQSMVLVLVVTDNWLLKLDGSLPANPVNDQRVANAVTLKSTFCLP